MTSEFTHQGSASPTDAQVRELVEAARALVRAKRLRCGITLPDDSMIDMLSCALAPFTLTRETIIREYGADVIRNPATPRWVVVAVGDALFSKDVRTEDEGLAMLRAMIRDGRLKPLAERLKGE